MYYRIFALLSWIFFFTQLANAQFKYSIQLELPTQFEGDTISLDVNNTFENKSYKKIVKGGIVAFTGIMQTKYSSAYIYFDKGPLSIDTSFYFGNIPVRIECNNTNSSVNPFLNCSFKNVFFQKLFKEMEDSLFAEQTASKVAYLEFRNGNIPNKDSLKKIFLEKRMQYERKLLQFINNNRNSYFAFSYFDSYFVRRADYSTADSLLKFFQRTFPKKILNSREGDFIKKTLISKTQILEGAFAPSFSSTDFYGNKKSFSRKNATGEYTLLQFWASWCAPCIREIPTIKKIRKKFSENNLRIISVSIDIDTNKWKAAVKKYKLFWENINDLNVSKTYGVSAIPAIFLISPAGVIIYSSEERGDTELLENLNSLLQNSLNIDNIK